MSVSPAVCFFFFIRPVLMQLRIYVATPKALRTSAQPGLTRALSTRLKLSEDPLVYSYDTPGVMLPFLGRGAKGAERGVKLALIGMQFHRKTTSTIYEWTNSTWFSWY